MSRKPKTFSVRGRVILMYGLLLAMNAAAWLWAAAAFRHYPVLLGTAFLAYAFGLRHAVDADHIAAIDNVTRKLMQQGQRPVGVGFFFSVGHSTIVFALSAAVAIASAALRGRFASLSGMGDVLGTCVSAGFLMAIAAANIAILVPIWRAFRAVRRGGAYAEEDIQLLLGKRGFFGRIFRSIYQLIGHSWQMYLVGFLFGLGFDTATEVAVLGVSAKEAAEGLSAWAIMIFPMLFTAGMALVDTTDGVVMLGAYHWAFVNPMRKLYYNLTITLVSIVVAVLIGGIELVGLLAERLGLQGGIVGAISRLNNHFGALGFTVIGVFVLSWVASIAVYRWNRYDDIRAAPRTTV